jgi:amicyanin
LYRPPNLGGTWTGEGGVAQFNFLHRFYVASSDGYHKVTNFPTFTLGAGVVDRVFAGLRYASNSNLVPPAVEYRPNEAELFVRWRPIGAAEGPGLAVAVTPAYNTAARSFDAELSADHTAGRVTVSGAARMLGTPFGIDSAGAKLALAGGASVRLNRYVAIGGDVAQLLDADTNLVWSAGLSFLIPGSPHTFSLHASKATSTTIQGSSVNGFDKVVYGFEFTIPLHLARFSAWFSGGAAAADAGEVAATVRIAQLGFQTDTVTVQAGQTVRWLNDDELAHTVTFADATIPSSRDLARGQAFAHRFDRPGTYTYSCTPHPFMRGVVVVR